LRRERKREREREKERWKREESCSVYIDQIFVKISR